MLSSGMLRRDFLYKFTAASSELPARAFYQMIEGVTGKTALLYTV
jgi:hypothetical protein